MLSFLDLNHFFTLKNWTKLLNTFILFFTITLCVSSFAQNNQENTDPSKINFKNLKNESVTLESFKNKYVFLNFWASWCAPCKHEFQVLNKVHEKYKDKLVIIAINVDEDEKKMVEFLKDNKPLFIVWKSIEKDKEKNIKQLGGAGVIPFNILYGKNLEFVAHLKGVREMHQLRGIIEPLLAGDR